MWSGWADLLVLDISWVYKMCDHRTCIPLVLPSHHVERWTQRTFEMVAAVRRGLLPIAHLNRIASPAMARELVKYVTTEPHTVKAKLQWCKAEFFAFSGEDPPAYTGSIAQWDGSLWLVAFHVLPPRRY